MIPISPDVIMEAVKMQRENIAAAGRMATSIVEKSGMGVGERYNNTTLGDLHQEVVDTYIAQYPEWPFEVIPEHQPSWEVDGEKTVIDHDHLDFIRRQKIQHKREETRNKQKLTVLAFGGMALVIGGVALVMLV